MAVFRIERNKSYTVMSNYHLRDKSISLKAKGLLSQMLSLPEEWDYTLSGLAYINKESKDAIRTAVNELEQAGYIHRHQKRNERGGFAANEYVIYERPMLEEPSAGNPTTGNTLPENPTQLNKDRTRKDKSSKMFGQSAPFVRPAQRTVLPTQRILPRAAQCPQAPVKAMGKSAKTAVEKSFYAVRAAISSTKTLIAAITAGGWVAVLAVVVIVLFGGVLSMVGGGNATAALPVSEEVEAYEPLIRLYATEYGIPEYVELIKAIMMQESGGRGLDPMQASESGYNTRYPNTAGSITDPKYSIRCGVQTIRDVLERADVESPLDMEHIKLALQGYNYGPGYITWAVTACQRTPVFNERKPGFFHENG